MKQFLVISFLVVASSSFAQTCPVVPTNLTLTTSIPFQPGHESAIRIEWKNVSDKPASGVSFRVAYYAMNEIRELATVFEYDGPPKGSYAYSHPFKKTANYWDNYENRTNRGRVWVNKVAFRDGTVWEDDGSISCAFEINK